MMRGTTMEMKREMKRQKSEMKRGLTMCQAKSAENQVWKNMEMKR